MTDKRTKIRVFVIGLRGFPDVQGGIETHAENLYPLVVENGISVTCATRSPYHNHEQEFYRGVALDPIWAPSSRYGEALIHSILAVLKAARTRPDIVHIHAVGPGLVAPLARIFGLRVVVTHHGPDYDREKWNRVARWVLRMGEQFGMKFAHRRIAISEVIRAMIADKYKLDSTVISNGVQLPILDADAKSLTSLELEPHSYVLLVSRLVPEKRHLDLIDAFVQANLPGWKLALVGDADHPDDYIQLISRKANEHQNVVLTGFQTGSNLKALYQYAGMFVLPSSHEGLPISLLEALSFGLPCLASSIPANKCVGMNDYSYFELGNTDELSEKIGALAMRDWDDSDRSQVREWIGQCFNWRRIARQTADVYRETIDEK